jgi:diguanylate cyclase (GGDEF)-like protein
VPPELAIVALTALLVGLLLMGAMLAGHRAPGEEMTADVAAERAIAALSSRAAPSTTAGFREPRGPESTLRVAWWLTVTIVLLGVGLSGSFVADQRSIFVLGGAAVATVVVLHEILGKADRGRLLHVVEVVAAVGLIGGLLALTGFASSPFAMLFALVSVAAALAYGPQAGLAAAGLATAAFAAVLGLDPQLSSYAPEDGLRLSIGLGATWLLAFVAIAYAGHQRRAVAHALALSRTDPLTSLFNRSQLFVTLEQEVSRTRRSDRGFCVLMIDVDGLKLINDTAGHLRGDDVLRALGAVIRTSIRNVDSAYRYGGDEFVVLLPETEIVGAFVVAEKIRAGAEEVGLALTETEPLTSVSIGLVSHPEDGLSAEELMTAADRAMYQAKRLGKNQISGNPRPRPALLARRSTFADVQAGRASRPAVEPARAADAAEPVAEAGAPATPAPAAPAPAGPAPVGPASAGPIPAASGTPPTRHPIDRPGREPAAVPIETPEVRAVAVELGPVVADDPPPHRAIEEEDDADPQEVRRRIASASRSFDPDHQIRRAMDAFLSPIGSEGDTRTTPEH